eukprot:874034-Pelagomonas_calceolata.AAC.3
MLTVCVCLRACMCVLPEVQPGSCLQTSQTTKAIPHGGALGGGREGFLASMSLDPATTVSQHQTKTGIIAHVRGLQRLNAV